MCENTCDVVIDHSTHLLSATTVNANPSICNPDPTTSTSISSMVGNSATFSSASVETTCITTQVVPITTVTTTIVSTVSSTVSVTQAVPINPTQGSNQQTTDGCTNASTHLVSATTVNANPSICNPVNTTTSTSITSMVENSTILNSASVETTCITTQVVPITTVTTTIINISTVSTSVSVIPSMPINPTQGSNLQTADDGTNSCNASSIISKVSTTTVTQSQITIYSTVTSTVTNIISATPSMPIDSLGTQSSNQQINNDGASSCSAVAICIPVAGVFALVTCVIVFVAVRWVRQNSKVAYSLETKNPEMMKVYNDLYGSVNLYAFT